MQQATVSIDGLADYLFLRSPKDSILYLNINGLEGTKDIFCFCFDLFCKGLVLLFGQGHTRVAVDDITPQQFESVIEKLKLAGIKTHIVVEDFETYRIIHDFSAVEDRFLSQIQKPTIYDLDEKEKEDLKRLEYQVIMSESARTLQVAPENLPKVTDYNFRMGVGNQVYVITFELLRI
jgi:hypothetical protein